MIGKRSNNGYKEVLPGINIKTLCFGENTLMTEFILKKGAILNEHKHSNEQTGYLISGKIRLFVKNESRVLTPGDSWNISSNIPHKAEIIEDSIAIEIFSPCREDYIIYLNQSDVIE